MKTRFWTFLLDLSIALTSWADRLYLIVWHKVEARRTADMDRLTDE